MSRLRVARLALGPVALAALLLAPPAHAGGDDEISRAQNEINAVTSEAGGVQSAVNKAKGQVMTVDQRLANGELLYRMKDFDRAILVFSEIIEGYPDTPSAVDAQWLRGETFYDAGDYLSARRDYRAIVKRGTEPRYAPYVSKSLARMVDVSFRLDDIAGLDEVFQNLNLVPPAQVDAALTYAKGKAYYAKKDYQDANHQFSAVPANTRYTHQARYFQALIVLKQLQPTAAAAPPTTAGPAPAAPAQKINYKTAIDAFKQVTDLPPDTEEHRHVIDLAWMAIGRLAYQEEQFQLASEAYSKIGRDSPEFDTMLYELAWVYVRDGDVERAERALEVLSIANPDSNYMADGTLLRADLLLRAGAFDKALQLYQSVRAQYDPMRQKVDTFLSSTSDVSVYYDKLSAQQLDMLDQNDQLPPVAIRWAREEEDGPLAFAVIDDVNDCKKLIKDSELLVQKLNALTQASNRVRAFPDLLAGEELALGLLNRLSRARLELAKGMDGEESGDIGGEMGQVRDQRRKLMAAMSGLPTNSAEFAQRDHEGEQQWNTVSQQLSRGQLEIDQLQAVVNGLRRMLKEDAQNGVTRDPAAVQRFNAEIDQNEHDLKTDKEEVAALRQQIEMGRAQIGLGDLRYQNDANARSQFRDVFDREVQLAGAGQGGGDARTYAGRIQGPLGQIRSQEDQLVAAFMQLETQVAARTKVLQGKIDAESANIANYKEQLGKLDDEARDLVGHVAQRNFGLVRDKLRNIVLRADVGVTEQAWEVREEELDRVRNLQTERSRQEQLLDEELKEVLDDSGQSDQSSSTQAPK